jgi:hypothetical protein
MDRSATQICRDCNTELPADAYGCGRCGRNFRAERRIALALGWLAGLGIALLVGFGYVISR